MSNVGDRQPLSSFGVWRDTLHAAAKIIFQRSAVLPTIQGIQLVPAAVPCPAEQEMDESRGCGQDAELARMETKSPRCGVCSAVRRAC
jgi:hypothetical protein